MANRIIFYPEFNIYGGEERNVVAFCHHLTRWAIPHEVVCYEDNMGLANYTKDPVKVTQLRPKGGGFSRPLAMGKYLREAAGNHSGRIYMGNLQSATHAGLVKVPDFVLRVSDTPSLLSFDRKVAFRGLRHWATKRGMKKAHAVVATTRYLADELSTLYGIEPKIIPIGGNTDKLIFKNRPAGEDGQINLMSVCRLEASKRIDWILEVLRDLGLDHSMGNRKFHLDIVGAGSQLPELEKLAADLGIREAVAFHGFLNDMDLERVFERAHMFLMPAKQGFGMPLVEALARGIPTVCNKESGASEYFPDTPWVGLFEGGEKAFLEATRQVIFNLESGKIHRAPLPEIPTEENWVRGLVELLGW